MRCASASDGVEADRAFLWLASRPANTTPAGRELAPVNLRAPSGSRSHAAATIAPKNGLVAFRIAAFDAEMNCSAVKLNSANGSADDRAYRQIRTPVRGERWHIAHG